MKFPFHAGNHWREYFYNTSIQINPGIPVIVWSPVKISNKPVIGFSPRCSDTVSFHCEALPAMPTDIQGYAPVVQAPWLVLEGDNGFTMLQGLHLGTAPACPLNEVRAALSANILSNTASGREQLEREAIKAHHYIIY